MENNNKPEFWSTLLRESVQAFNAERLQRPDDEIVDLDSAELSGMDLREANLSRANLSHVNFRGSHLPAGQFRSSRTLDAHFDDAIWASDEDKEVVEIMDKLHKHAKKFNLYRKKADPSFSLREVYLADLKLRHLDLRHLDLSSVNADWADFRKCKLQGARFHNARLHWANFEGMTLEDVDFSGSDLQNARFSGATLIRVNFSGVRMTRGAFKNTTLIEVTSKGGQFVRSNFNGATLEDCDLSGSEFHDCEFRGSCIKATNFSEGRLSYSNFESATLKQCVMHGTDLEAAWFCFSALDASSVAGALNLDQAVIDPLLREFLTSSLVDSEELFSVEGARLALNCGYCGKGYLEEDNHDKACRHHPEFYFPYDIDTEGKHHKGWQCCSSENKRKAGCQRTRHRHDIRKVSFPGSIKYKYVEVNPTLQAQVDARNAAMSRHWEIQEEINSTDPVILETRRALNSMMGRPVQAFINCVGPPTHALSTTDETSGRVSYSQIHFYVWRGVYFEVLTSDTRVNGDEIQPEHITVESIWWHLDMMHQEHTRRGRRFSASHTDVEKLWDCGSRT